MDHTLIKTNTLFLESIFDSDQQGIQAFKAGQKSSSELAEVNSNNVLLVKKIIIESGFPTIKKTSYKAYKAAVLVALHSGDVDFLNQSIQNLQNAERSAIEKKDIAYLTDKARVIRNLPQLYGTQYKVNQNGVPEFTEIEDLVNLEKRRVELGMESFVEYKETVELLFGVTTKNKP